jgi:hypothetical protein
MITDENLDKKKPWDTAVGFQKRIKNVTTTMLLQTKTATFFTIRSTIKGGNAVSYLTMTNDSYQMNDE